MPKIKLISSKLSPYAHRVEITLIEKNIPYDKQEVDLVNKPDFLIKDCPTAKVPLLYTDGKPLFESVAICEYLDEAFPENQLHPKDIYIKSWHRGWMEFSSGIIASTFGLVFALDQQSFDIKKAEIDAKLKILNNNLKFNPYFDGDRYSLVDIFFASAFKPLIFIDKTFTLELFDLYKNVATYIEGAITRGSINKALANDYEDVFKRFIQKKKSHLLTMSFSI